MKAYFLMRAAFEGGRGLEIGHRIRSDGGGAGPTDGRVSRENDVERVRPRTGSLGPDGLKEKGSRPD